MRDIDESLGEELRVTVPAMSPGTYDVVVTNADGESATLSQALRIRKREITCKHVTVNFDFDRSNIRSDAESTLNANMDCYTQLRGSINVEGHADERGTVEYNLALGERRATSVKRFLTSGGVAGSQVDTVSYGENRPVATGSNEKAWAANRRAELHASE